MPAPTPTYAYAELTDGTRFDGVRITLATKIQLEKTMKANRWTTEDNPFTTSAFMAWHAGRIAQKIPSALTFEDFTAQCVDAGVTLDNDAEDDEDPEGPTSPATGTTPPSL